MNNIAPNSAPLYKGEHYKIHTLLQIVLPYPLPPSLRPFYTFAHIHTTHNSLALNAFPSSVGAIDQAQILFYPLIQPVNGVVFP
jgi:hypothetical protein